MQNQISKIKNQNDKLKVKNNFYIFICIFAFLFLIFNFSMAYAWKLPIEVSTATDNGDKVYNKLVVGIEPDATDGFDNLWDTPAIVSHPDPDAPLLLRSYITPFLSIEEGQGGSGEAGMSGLWKDIRSTTSKGDTVWEIAVDSVPKGKTVDISWNVPQGLLKAGERLVLKDNDRIGTDGKPAETDMTWASNYSFVSESEEPKSLSLVLSKEAVNNSKSGSGSGFGCGTVKPNNNGSANGGEDAFSIVMLFLLLIFVRLLRGLCPSQ